MMTLTAGLFSITCLLFILCLLPPYTNAPVNFFHFLFGPLPGKLKTHPSCLPAHGCPQILPLPQRSDCQRKLIGFSPAAQKAVLSLADILPRPPAVCGH